MAGGPSAAHERIERLILLVRGEKVILDRDLAVLYGVETQTLVQAVMRNMGCLPTDFMFQLNRRECTILTSQIVMSNGRGGRRHLQYAFAEQGVAMLSSVLRSTQAVQVNIKIMRAIRDAGEVLIGYHEWDELKARAAEPAHPMEG